MKKTIAIVGIIGAFTVGIAFAVISNSDDVKIRELILKSRNNSPSCVTPETAEKLIARNWGYQ